MLYVFVDTNIWFRFITQGRPGCEPRHYRELKEAAAKGKIELLYLEIVGLELEKLWASFGDDLKSATEKLEKLVKEPLGKSVWSEIDDIQSGIAGFIKQRKDSKIEEAKDRYKDLSAF